MFHQSIMNSIDIPMKHSIFNYQGEMEYVFKNSNSDDYDDCGGGKNALS